MIAGPDGRPQRVPVRVQKAHNGSKLYLGGYRNKQSGFFYHHASSQTTEGLTLRDGWINPELKSHRETQTCLVKSRSVMTGREFGTQMERTDILLDRSKDVVVFSKPYFSSIQLDEVKRKSTLVIQCYWRGYVARRRAWDIREALYNDYVAEQKVAAKVDV
jgi:hypothetical protein